MSSSPSQDLEASQSQSQSQSQSKSSSSSARQKLNLPIIPAASNFKSNEVKDDNPPSHEINYFKDSEISPSQDKRPSDSPQTYERVNHQNPSLADFLNDDNGGIEKAITVLSENQFPVTDKELELWKLDVEYGNFHPKRSEHYQFELLNLPTELKSATPKKEKHSSPIEGPNFLSNDNEEAKPDQNGNCFFATLNKAEWQRLRRSHRILQNLQIPLVVKEAQNIQAIIILKNTIDLASLEKKISEQSGHTIIVKQKEIKRKVKKNVFQKKPFLIKNESENKPAYEKKDENLREPNIMDQLRPSSDEEVTFDPKGSKKRKPDNTSLGKKGIKLSSGEEIFREPILDDQTSREKDDKILSEINEKMEKMLELHEESTKNILKSNQGDIQYILDNYNNQIMNQFVNTQDIQIQGNFEGFEDEMEELFESTKQKILDLCHEHEKQSDHLVNTQNNQIQGNMAAFKDELEKMLNANEKKFKEVLDANEKKTKEVLNGIEGRIEGKIEKMLEANQTEFKKTLESFERRAEERKNESLANTVWNWLKDKLTSS